MSHLPQFKGSRILVVGDVMLDRYWWGSVDRISPEAPVPIVRLDHMSAAPGGAANVAVNIAALGGSPVLIGCGGSDAERSELKDSLRSNRVDSDHILAFASRRTTVKTRIVAHQQQVVRIDQEDPSTISSAESEKVCGLISDLLPESDLVIVSDYAKGILSEAVLSYVLGACNETGKICLVDPKGNQFSKYAGATMITPNRREAAQACNLVESMDDLVQVAGKTLIKEFDFENVLITEGEHGMTLFEKERTFHVDAAAHQVFDVTGAGDTVIATLGMAVAAGFDLRSAVSVANTAAGISVGRVGANAVTFDSLAEELGRQAMTTTSNR